MSALRQRLKQPQTWLALTAVVLALAAYDATRQPETQLGARTYVQLVELYQSYGRPLSSRIFQCRYKPTCSEYSRQAVVRFGIAEGLRLTFTRLASCRSSVPLGTHDPVPYQTNGRQRE